MSALQPLERRVDSEVNVAFISTYFKCLMQFYAVCSVSGGSHQTSVDWAGCDCLPEPPTTHLDWFSLFSHYLHVCSHHFGLLRSVQTYFSICKRWKSPFCESLESRGHSCVLSTSVVTVERSQLSEPAFPHFLGRGLRRCGQNCVGNDNNQFC